MSTTAEGLRVDIQDGIAWISFFHQKANSLPGKILDDMISAIEGVSVEPRVGAVVIQSRGDGAFCAGASFDEFKQLDNLEQATEFFLKFGRLGLAMIRCPKFVLSRVHGKVVAGGLGIVAASDYSLASSAASAKLSELTIGIGPFVVGPFVARRIGLPFFAQMTIDAEWRDASWGLNSGLYSKVFSSVEELDAGVSALALKLAQAPASTSQELKRVFWAGTENWDELIEARARLSGQALLNTKND